MSVIDLALPLIKAAEGFRAHPYLCPAGVWTIGFGTTQYPNGRHVSGGDPAITEDEAEMYLCLDLEWRWNAIAARMTREPIDNQGAAMLSLAYNIGVTAFFNSTLLRKFNAGDIAGAAGEFVRWNKARVGSALMPVEGLTVRRLRERDLFLGEHL